MSVTSISPHTRNTTLDLIRAVAIIVIIFHHAYIPLYPIAVTIPNKLYTLFISFLNICHTGGWVAVDLFFVLSGFLVSGLLFNEYKKHRRIDVKSFIVRRGFKIYPAFIFFIIGTFVFELVLASVNHKEAPSVINSLKDLFFLHNYLGGRWIHTWSLDVEEFFYLSIPFCIAYLYKKQKLNLNTLIKTYLLLLTFGIICRWLNMNNAARYDFDAQFIKTHYRLDGLFLGVIISYIFNFKPQLLNVIHDNKFLAVMLSVALITVNFCFPRESNLWISVVMLAVNPFAFAVLLVLALKHLVYAGNKLLLRIGRCSYSIYLWHLFFNFYGSAALLKLITRPALANHHQLLYIIYLVVYIALSFAVGIFMTTLIEKPVLKLRDRYYPSKISHIVTPAGK
jgi:peptidoglycan/LPS O-acetylase OafA/YrhL